MENDVEVKQEVFQIGYETNHEAMQVDNVNENLLKYTVKTEFEQNKGSNSRDEDEEVDVVNFSSPDETSQNQASYNPCQPEEDDIDNDRLLIIENDETEYSSEQSQISEYEIIEFPKIPEENENQFIENPKEKSSSQLEKEIILVTDIKVEDPIEGKDVKEVNEVSDLCSLSAVDINNSLFDTIASLGQSNIKPEDKNKQTSLENVVNNIKSKPKHYHMQKTSENFSPTDLNVSQNEVEPLRPKKKKKINTSPKKTKKRWLKKKAQALEPGKTSTKQDYSKRVAGCAIEKYNGDKEVEQEKKLETSQTEKIENVSRNIPMKLKLKNFCKAQQMLANVKDQNQAPVAAANHVGENSVSEGKDDRNIKSHPEPATETHPHARVCRTNTGIDDTSISSTKSSQTAINVSASQSNFLHAIGASMIASLPDLCSIGSQKLKYYEEKKHLLECQLKILGLSKQILEKKNMQQYLKQQMYQNRTKVKNASGSLESLKASNSSSSVTGRKKTTSVKLPETRDRAGACYTHPVVTKGDNQGENSTHKENICKRETHIQNNNKSSEHATLPIPGMGDKVETNDESTCLGNSTLNKLLKDSSQSRMEHKGRKTATNEQPKETMLMNSFQKDKMIQKQDIEKVKSIVQKESLKLLSDDNVHDNLSFAKKQESGKRKGNKQSHSIQKDSVTTKQDKKNTARDKPVTSKATCELIEVPESKTSMTNITKISSKPQLSQKVSLASSAPIILVPVAANTIPAQPFMPKNTVTPGRYIIGHSQLPNNQATVSKSSTSAQSQKVVSANDINWHSQTFGTEHAKSFPCASHTIVQSPYNMPMLSVYGKNAHPIATPNLQNKLWPVVHVPNITSTEQSTVQNPNILLLSPPYSANTSSNKYPFMTAKPPIISTNPIMSTITQESKSMTQTTSPKDIITINSVSAKSTPSSEQRKKQIRFNILNSFEKNEGQSARQVRNKINDDKSSYYCENKIDTDSLNNETCSTELDFNNNVYMSPQKPSSKSVYQPGHVECSSDSQESFDSVDWQRYKDACIVRKPCNHTEGQSQVIGNDLTEVKVVAELLQDEENAGPAENKDDHSQVHIQDITTKRNCCTTMTKKRLKTKLIVLKDDMCDKWQKIKFMSGYENLADEIFFNHLLKIEEVKLKNMTTKNKHKESADVSPESSSTCKGNLPQAVCCGMAHRNTLNVCNGLSILDHRTPKKQTQGAGDATPYASPSAQTPGSVTATETQGAGGIESPIVIPKTPDKQDIDTMNACGDGDNVDNAANKADRSNEKIADKKRKLDSSVDERGETLHPEKKRFRFLSETTKRQMAWAVFIFKDFLHESGDDTSIQFKSASWMNQKLGLFYQKAKTLDGEPYRSEILQEFRRALSMALCSTSTTIKMGISFASEYMTSNVLLSCIMRADERNSTQPAKPISSEDIEKLYSTKVFSDEHPLSLVWKVWFDIVQHMCNAKMPQNFLYCLKKKNLSLESDIHGVYYKFVDLGLMPGSQEPGRMYATPTVPERCPVRTLSLYLSRLSMHCSYLFQCPAAMWRYKDQTWYLPEPMKRDLIYQMMERISSAAKLTTVYSTANVLATQKPVVKEEVP